MPKMSGALKGLENLDLRAGRMTALGEDNAEHVI